MKALIALLIIAAFLFLFFGTAAWADKAQDDLSGRKRKKQDRTDPEQRKLF